MARGRGSAAAVLVVTLPSHALAHPGAPPERHELFSWAAWPWDPFVLLSLALAAALYVTGTLTLYRRARRGRGLLRWRAAAFSGGWLVVVLALVTPLHRLGEALFSAHMAQHTLLLLVAAPMLVASAPLASFLWALPPRWRRPLGRALHARPLRSAWRALSHPLSAWLLHAVALWLWHAPVLYQATLEDDVVHAAQHVSFLGAGLLFWHVLSRAAKEPRTASIGLLYVFTTAAHASLLGALLTFAPTPLYPAYAGRGEPWGLTLLEDQQLGGMLMWVPGGLLYVLAALTLLGALLRRLERDARHPAERQWGEAAVLHHKRSPREEASS